MKRWDETLDLSELYVVSSVGGEELSVSLQLLYMQRFKQGV